MAADFHSHFRYSDNAQHVIEKLMIWTQTGDLSDKSQMTLSKQSAACACRCASGIVNAQEERTADALSHILTSSFDIGGWEVD